MPYLVFAYTDDALGSMYKGSLFVCCRGVVVASPAGWYPIPALTAWGVSKRVKRRPGLGADGRELGREVCSPATARRP